MSDITEEKLINFETVVRRDYESEIKFQENNKDENEKIQYLKQKPISELTVEEVSLLKKRNII
jgi:dUTPase